MKRRRDEVREPEERDALLGKALDELDTPEYPAGFLAEVWARVDAGEGEAAGSAGAAPAPQATRRRWFRRPLVAAVAAAVVVAAVAAAVLVGLPGGSRLGGPEPVSAAQVIQKALRAMSSGKTLVMAITEKDIVDPYAAAPRYTTTRVRLTMRADGSYRGVQTDVAPPGEARGRSPYGFEGTAYDAGTGVQRHWVTGWEDDYAGYRRDGEVTTGWPLGPPDDWISMESGLTGVALALRSAGEATVTATTFLGRPAWVVSANGVFAYSDPSERDAVTIDKETCLPLRLQSWQGGVLQRDYTWRTVSRDARLPGSAFTSMPTRGMRIERSDAGFRRLSLDEIAATPGYAAVVPVGGLPAGYRLRWVASADHSVTANGEIRGRNVFTSQYGRGFDSLWISTRSVASPQPARESDPIEWDASYALRLRRPVRLTRGAFAGATASVVAGRGIMIPHLSLVKGNVLLTVTGAATADELIAVAESLQRYTGQAGSPPASTSGD